MVEILCGFQRLLWVSERCRRRETLKKGKLELKAAHRKISVEDSKGLILSQFLGFIMML